MAARIYFAGANTQSGFRSFFEDVLPTADNSKILYIHGAPGTGKSTLMRRLAAQWEDAGREVTYYPCASDPDSLDAVVSGAFAALDATPPHALAGDLPGIETHAIDLSAALDAALLASSREEAKRLSRRMKQQYQRGYRCLTAAQAAKEDAAAIYNAAVDHGSLCNLRLELMQFLRGDAGRAQRVFTHAVTGGGVVGHAEAVVRPDTVCLDLPFGFDANVVLHPLAVCLSARGVGHIRGMDMLGGTRVEHIATPTHAVVSFMEPGCEARALRFDEGLLRAEREALDFNRAAHDLWLSRAVEAFAQARAAHDALERVYADAVDEKRRAEICEEEGERYFLLRRK